MVRDYFDFYSWDGKFYDTLKERVEKVVPKENRRHHWEMYAKFWVIIFMFFLSMYWNLKYYTWYTCINFAFWGAQVGVNIMHDGNHMAFSDSKLINRIAGFSLELVGTSAIIYKRSHDFGHHGCVNHLELDRAFDTTYPLIRLHPGLPWLPYHKW